MDTSAEHVKELEDELLKLRIENAYLKELREAAFRGGNSSEKNSENCPQSPRTVQIKRHSRSSRFSKGNIYMYWQKRFDRENLINSWRMKSLKSI